MARVTVEDCLKNVKNRFELVLIASKRARQLMRGKEAHVEWDNDKATVVALREIAEGYTNFDTPTQEEQETAAMLESLNANSLAKEQIKEAAELEEAADAAETTETTEEVVVISETIEVATTDEKEPDSTPNAEPATEENKEPGQD